MKRKYKFIWVVLLLLAFSCTTDFLEEVHSTKQTAGTFFTNDAEAEQAAISLYEFLSNSYGNALQNWIPDLDMSRGDNLILPKNNWKNLIVEWLTLNYNAETGSVRDAWRRSYTTIYRANWIIDNVTDNENISEPVKKKVLSEAYFLRGYSYFTLARLFEEVPLMLNQTSLENYYPEKATSEEVWAQADSDMQQALSLGGLPAPQANFVDGRVNTGVANAIIARSYLYRTRPGSDQYWDKVKQYAEAVKNLNVYGLEPMEDFSRIFVYTKEDTWVKNSEMIWAAGFIYGPIYGGTPFIYKNAANIGAVTSVPVGYQPIIVRNDTGDPYLPGNGRTGWAFVAASPALTDVMIDYGEKGDKRTTEWLYYPTFNDYGLESKDDPTSVYLKSTIKADSLYQALKASNGAEGEYVHISKFKIREFIGTNIWDGGFNHPMMYPIIRYADVILMLAEAEFNLGNEGGAKTYLKMVTDRAGFAADYTAQFSGQALLDEIQQQRRVELMFESQRVPDLIRQDKFKPPYVGTYEGAVTFEEKLKVLPVPQRELDYNPNLVQHPLWR